MSGRGNLVVFAPGLWLDVSPVANFVSTLTEHGYAVKFLAMGVFRERVSSLSPLCTFIGLAGDPTIELNREGFRSAVLGGVESRAALHLRNFFQEHLESNMISLRDAASGWADGCLASTQGHIESISVCQRLQIPVILLPTGPLDKSGEVDLPPPTIPSAPTLIQQIGSEVYKFCHEEFTSLLGFLPFAARVNATRKRVLGLGSPHCFTNIQGFCQIQSSVAALLDGGPFSGGGGVGGGGGESSSSSAGGSSAAAGAQAAPAATSNSSSSGSMMSVSHDPRGATATVAAAAAAATFACGPWLPSESVSERLLQSASPLSTRFLHGGGISDDVTRRPIIVDFGDMPVPEPAQFIKLLHSISAKLGLPILWSAGETDISALPKSPLLSSCDGLVWDLPSSSKEPQMMAPSAAGGPSSPSPSAAGGPPSPSSSAASSSLPTSRVRVIVTHHLELRSALPRCQLLVHNGSGASTGVAAYHGIPTLCFPVLAEHTFWSFRSAAAGLSLPPSGGMNTLFERLEAALRESLSRGSLRERAHLLGAELRGLGDARLIAMRELAKALRRPQNRHCGLECKWMKDDEHSACTICSAPFTLLSRKHHCRSCGNLACEACLAQRCHLPGYPECSPEKVCNSCLTRRRQRLLLESATMPSPQQTSSQASAGSAALGGKAMGGLNDTVEVPLGGGDISSAVSSLSPSSVPLGRVSERLTFGTAAHSIEGSSPPPMGRVSERLVFGTASTL